MIVDGWWVSWCFSIFFRIWWILMVSSFFAEFFYRIRLRGSNKVGARAFNVQGWSRKECKERLHFMRCRVGWGWGWWWLLLLLIPIVINYQYNYAHHYRHPIFVVLRISRSQGLAPSLSIVAQEEKKTPGGSVLFGQLSHWKCHWGFLQESGVSLDSLCSKQFILTVLWLWFMEKFSFINFIIVWIYPSRTDSLPSVWS